jgi:hypothetical protein
MEAEYRVTYNGAVYRIEKKKLNLFGKIVWRPVTNEYHSLEYAKIRLKELSSKRNEWIPIDV